MDCVFCKIVGGTIPSDKVYEDKNYLAFLDINPVNPGHTLVIPKKHFERLTDVDEETLKGLVVVVKKVAAAVVRATGADGFNLHQSNGRAAGQVVNHVHFHVWPRFENDGKVTIREHQKYQGTESKELAAKIKQFI